MKALYFLVLITYNEELCKFNSVSSHACFWNYVYVANFRIALNFLWFQNLKKTRIFLFLIGIQDFYIIKNNTYLLMFLNNHWCNMIGLHTKLFFVMYFYIRQSSMYAFKRLFTVT